MPVPKRKPQPPIDGEAVLFKRVGKVPRSVMSAADLWLDMYMQFADTLLMRESGNDLQQVSRAAQLADMALDIYQQRWPNVDPA